MIPDDILEDMINDLMIHRHVIPNRDQHTFNSYDHLRMLIHGHFNKDQHLNHHNSVR